MDTGTEQKGGEPAGRQSAGPDAGFRIVDRRRIRLDAEPAGAESAGPAAGEPAGGPAEGRRPVEPTAEQPAGTPGAGAGTPRGEGTRTAPAGEARDRGTGEARGRRQDAPLPPPTFTTLVNTLALNTVAALGLAADRSEEGASAAADLPLARHTIDLLGMLEQKTAGNLSPDEARLLEQTLFELRMLFVRASSRTT